MSNRNEPAYPVTYTANDQIDIGLTKREYFAAMAMQGYLASLYELGAHSPASSCEIADALLEELEKR